MSAGKVLTIHHQNETNFRKRIIAVFQLQLPVCRDRLQGLRRWASRLTFPTTFTKSWNGRANRFSFFSSKSNNWSSDSQKIKLRISKNCSTIWKLQRMRIFHKYLGLLYLQHLFGFLFELPMFIWILNWKSVFVSSHQLDLVLQNIQLKWITVLSFVVDPNSTVLYNTQFQKSSWTVWQFYQCNASSIFKTLKKLFSIVAQLSDLLSKSRPLILWNVFSEAKPSLIFPNAETKISLSSNRPNVEPNQIILTNRTNVKQTFRNANTKICHFRKSEINFQKMFQMTRTGKKNTIKFCVISVKILNHVLAHLKSCCCKNA